MAGVPVKIQRAILTLLALCSHPAAARAQEPAAPVPGESLRGPPVPLGRALARCLDLPWAATQTATPDARSDGGCAVVRTGALPGTGSMRWWWALYDRFSLSGSGADPSSAGSAMPPDTIRMDELVLFAGADEGAVDAVWHDRAERDLERIAAPRADGELLVHRRCLAGTGGCLDHPYHLGADGAVRPFDPRYREQIRQALPEEWATNKGIWIDLPERIARAAVYLPLDANCCPSFRAEASVQSVGDLLLSGGVSITPDSTGDLWRVVPGERFGPVGPDMSETGLRALLGASRVVPADVYLGEGLCTSGAHIFPGRDWQVDVAWADSARSRPAFARARGPGAPWRTDRGVGIGTTLRRLEELRGEPVSFGGLGWDYGGGIEWPEGGGTVSLRLDVDPTQRALLDTLARTNPRLVELYGDRQVRSDHPLLDTLTLRVVEMGMGWRAAYDERDCEQPGAGR